MRIAVSSSVASLSSVTTVVTASRSPSVSFKAAAARAWLRLRAAYIAMVELLSHHLESSERQQRGHSQRVARLSVRMAEEMGLTQREVETLRIAALLHEVGLDDPRLARIVGN